ncbi:MAG: DUF4102 domain-containing protein [Magnetococcales bacterium]|nr:DUF4102 domain-containing protein [Magnetococcales bacterium]
MLAFLRQHFQAGISLHQAKWLVYTLAGSQPMTERATWMSLAGTTLRNLKPSDKPFQLTDGNGLFILVKTTGSRLWKISFRFDGKQRRLEPGNRFTHGGMIGGTTRLFVSSQTESQDTTLTNAKTELRNPLYEKISICYHRTRGVPCGCCTPVDCFCHICPGNGRPGKCSRSFGTGTHPDGVE